MEQKQGTNQTDIQFAGLIASLATGAFQHLGKVANQMTGKVERNLEAAKATIDLLVVLQKKTQGNLSNEEEQLLNNYITNLQLNYVDESKIPDAPVEKSSDASSSAARPAEGEAPQKRDRGKAMEDREEKTKKETSASSDKDGVDKESPSAPRPAKGEAPQERGRGKASEDRSDNKVKWSKTYEEEKEK
ncbi:DUF1844 domain-containing protein [Chlamydiota bacterium]